MSLIPKANAVAGADFATAVFYFHGLRRKLVSEFLICSDLLNNLFRVVLSLSVRCLYFSWNAFQKISRNFCTLSPFVYLMESKKTP